MHIQFRDPLRGGRETKRVPLWMSTVKHASATYYAASSPCFSSCDVAGSKVASDVYTADVDDAPSRLMGRVSAAKVTTAREVQAYNALHPLKAVSARAAAATIQQLGNARRTAVECSEPGPGEALRSRAHPEAVTATATAAGPAAVAEPSLRLSARLSSRGGTVGTVQQQAEERRARPPAWVSSCGCRTFYSCHPKQALAGVGQPGGRAGVVTPRGGSNPAPGLTLPR